MRDQNLESKSVGWGSWYGKVEKIKTVDLVDIA